MILLVTITVSAFFFLKTDHELHALQSSLSPEMSSIPLVVQIPFTGEHSKRAIAANESEKVILTVSEQHHSLIENLPENSSCVWDGELTSPQAAENFYAFDYKKYLFYQNIHWTYRVHNVRDCVTAEESVNTFLNNLRYKGIDRIDKIFPEGIKGIAGALLFGDRSDMEEEQIRMYQRLGVIHLLAISGMHVGMITLFLWKLLLKAGLTRETVRISLFFILPFYTVMAGAAPPVIRAAGMVLLGLSLQYVFVRLPLLHILSSVFMLHLFIFPLELVNAGFQLSYAVSFALALSSGKVLGSRNKFISLLMVTSIAQLGALPIILWHFYELSLSSFLMNLIFVPLYTLFILPSFIVIYLVSFISMDAAVYAAFIPSTIISALEDLARIISELKFSILITGKPSRWKVGILIAVGYMMMSCYEKSKYMAASCCLILFAGVLTFSPYINQKGSITFISVGQGDSILIQLPFNQGNYLIDTGGQVNFGQSKSTFSVGKEIVLPYLKSMGVSTIDLLILTHHDWDHIGGAGDLLSELKVKEVWTSGGSVQKEEMQELLKAFEHDAIPVKEILETQYWQVGGNEFTVMVPSDQLEGNNGSLVLHARLGGKKWLFTGDIEEETERDMLDQFGDIDVLKVAHHGSNSSSTGNFLEIVKPETAVVSAGRNNSYGHPHPDVMERLLDTGAKVYVTSEHGAVKYTFTGDHGTFETALPYNIEN
ncbi:DNA internalization-related competence protein ComEC/Rec2 [Jeotgalibacillus sp. HH7-29]|uniref:DNA internalization-related competence protein ComEC/Rec2 n=2 Tax=Jeotgalibacillus haloalkalitolerans TaxID=3104292 RepID=A0ABU5KLY8_9BACL|nr:DNA internalization-related competence protein ComEC/Rec2 [Jeotgalibacillus sp. HH7-29]